jgi:thioredoxin 1
MQKCTDYRSSSGNSHKSKFFRRSRTFTTSSAVGFLGAWCGPCRLVAPIIDQLAKELSGRVRVGKLDVDKNQMTAGRFRVQSIPTLLVLKDGQEVERIVGAQSKEAIVQRLKAYL